MEEDIRKQGMLYLQQQRFGKVRTSLHGEITVKLMLMKISEGLSHFIFAANFQTNFLHYCLFLIKTDVQQFS